VDKAEAKQQVNGRGTFMISTQPFMYRWTRYIQDYYTNVLCIEEKMEEVFS